MPKTAYSVTNLRKLWEVYHEAVHPSCMVPCDACPGDACYTTTFLDWLEEQDKLLPPAVERIQPLGRMSRDA